ncbi:MAG: glycosyltransferase family 4 protein, partial [Candidatus Thermoplasmatota archaeon]
KRFLFFESDRMHLIGKNAAGIPNGIILDIWNQIQIENIANAKRLLKKIFPEKEFVILFIGRSERRKGLPPLLEAMRKIKSEVSAGLVIASVMSDEEYKWYEWGLKSMGLEKDVVIDRTWLSDLDKASLLCAPDILALPSLYEPFGIVTLEGLAADYACERNGIVGPVVITGATGGMSDVIRSGVDGFKVPVENFKIDSDLLASLIVMVLEHPELRKSISFNASQRVQSDIFRWERILKHVIRTYDHAIMNYVLWKEET